MTAEPRYITEELARECLDVVKKFVGPDWDPALYPPGHEGPMWVVSLEGDEDWAVRIIDFNHCFPPGVFVEPVASWCLGLYPA